MKTCNVCLEDKPLEQFHNRSNSPDGKRYTCKSCSNLKSREWAKNNAERHRKNSRDWSRRNPIRCRQNYKNWAKNNTHKIVHNNAQRRYGLTTNAYEAMLSSQQAVCKICEKGETQKRRSRLSVDHCHKTGKVRGLLCSGCNKGLGYFKDSPEILRKAAAYLDKQRESDIL